MMDCELPVVLPPKKGAPPFEMFEAFCGGPALFKLIPDPLAVLLMMLCKDSKLPPMSLSELVFVLPKTLGVLFPEKGIPLS